MARDDEGHDDVELSDLEDGAFIPKPYDQPSALTRWMPPRLRVFVQNLSRIKIMLIMLGAFILLLAFLGWYGGGSKLASVTIPSASIKLSAEIATELSSTVIPDYVLKYAPMVLLDSDDKFFPSDMGIHLSQTHAAINFTTVTGAPDQLSLQNLHLLNDLGGENIYLTSNEDVKTFPKYLNAKAPDPKTLQTKDAKSCAVVVVDKGNGVTHAFYMYFYTFNQGPTAMGHELGDHLGDWEHNMIRFEDGKPKAIWYSQHDYGEAFTYAAVQKVHERPIVYSAKGSHANYVKAGTHDLHKGNEKIPGGVVFDHTSQGPVWDPVLSAYFYTYTPSTHQFEPSDSDTTPVNYLLFNGQWGDQEYASGTPGQDEFHGFHKWTGGPQGPLFKHLDRESVCWPSTERECVVLEDIEGEGVH